MNRIIVTGDAGAATGQLQDMSAALAAPAVALRKLSTAAGSLYCRKMHRAVSRPVGGKYRCWKCLREFEVGW